jgi:hypothetical protein
MPTEFAPIYHKTTYVWYRAGAQQFSRKHTRRCLLFESVPHGQQTYNINQLLQKKRGNRVELRKEKGKEEINEELRL